MDDESNQGMNKLARAIQERMNRNQDANSALVLDFGTIQKDMSLKTNTFAVPIPQADYHVARHLTLGPTGSHLTYTIGAGSSGDGTHNHGSSGSHTHAGCGYGSGHSGGEHVHNNEGPHVHDVLVPEKMRSIKPGDRVLVAWVQSEAVVIDVILRGTQV